MARSSDSSPSTRTAIVRTAVATAAGSAPGLLLPIVVVHVCHSRLSTDSYFFAVESALFAATIFTIALKTAVVPFFVEWRAANDSSDLIDRSLRLAFQAAGCTLAAYGVIATLVAALYLPVSELGQEQSEQIRILLLALAPAPALMAASSVLAGAHYSVDRWSFASWSESLRSIGPLILLVAGLVDDRLVVVALGMSVGEAARLILLWRGWNAVVAQSPAARHRSHVLTLATFRLFQPTAQTTAVWRLAAPQLASMVVINLNPLIDKVFAAGLSKGSITTLTLAEKLFFVPQTLLASAVALVLGTRWARMSMSGDTHMLRSDFIRWQAIAWAGGFVGIALAGFLTLGFSAPAASFLNVSRDTFAATFFLFVLGLPAALSAAISLRMYVALRYTRPLVGFALALVVVNVAFDYVGSHYWDVEGLAAASTAVRFTSAVLYLALLPAALKHFRRSLPPARAQTAALI